ncbi:MAG: hypothetical protein IJ630_00825 [Treponema sp.]|nr:hypothetical protein [Treponema sp.]
MKRKYITFAVFAISFMASLSAKTKLTFKNTVGADSDEIADYDFYSRSTEKEYSGGESTSSGFSFGDQAQLDLENNQLSLRARLTAFYQNFDDDMAKFVVIPEGYVHYSPIPQLGFAFGNNFSKHFAIPSAYLAADDTTTKYGRLLTDSLDEERYFGSDSFSVFTNGFAAGITSDWTLGTFGYLKLAGGATMYPDEDEFEKAIDFGVNAGAEELLDFGFTAHNVTDDERKFGAFAGFTGKENLILNAHFYYNFTTSDYLPEECVVGSDDYENDVYKFKKQSAKYALGLTGGYNFAEKGLGIYGDVITALTNEYIGTIKYYDSDGNLISTETTTIIRGGTVVKYKNGKAKRTDKFTHEGIPFYAQLRLNYQLSESVEALLNFKIRTLLHASDTTWITVYPRFKFDLPANAGTIGTGIRFDMNAARADGLTALSIPLTYTYKFKKKF